MVKIALNTPLEEIKGFGPKSLFKLKQLKIETVKDLLWHFPNRYIDFSTTYNIKDLKLGQEATISGKIIDIKNNYAWRNRMSITEAVISDNTGSIKAVWFNQPYITRSLVPGKKLNLSGKTYQRKGEIYFSNPLYETINNSKHTGRIISIYPETQGLTSKGIRFLIDKVIYDVDIVDYLPQEIIDRAKVPALQEAVTKIHLPENQKDISVARKRFAMEGLLLLQIHNAKERLELSSANSQAMKIDMEKIKTMLKNLPFELTRSQKKSLWEIIQDLEKKHPMNRLLQGDVGSGKTIVAAIAALQVAKNKAQVVFMAPTELLAHQHYQVFQSLFKEAEERVGLLTRTKSEIYFGKNLKSQVSKKDLKDRIANNRVGVIIGTHAIIQKDVKFSNLALVIVDEQHRFGVNQRKTLINKSPLQKTKTDSSNLPHFLSMSATPIPRTLALTIFSDLDISLITELPKHRKKIKTSVVAPKKRAAAYNFIKTKVKEGRQVFVICPKIESSETGTWSDIKAVKAEYEKLSKEIFPELTIAALHSKVQSRDKTEIMQQFATGKIDLIVATSVIEVGIDVPNATIMIIEDAERFGLAQLYQIRGRVGRGSHQSYCLLFSESPSKDARDRLRSIIQAKNGFELAEQDLKLRGPGEFLGTKQTGVPDIAMKAIQNPEIVKTSKEIAKDLISEDPELKKYPEIKSELKKLENGLHKE